MTKTSLTPAEHQLVMDELQELILRTIDLMNRFEEEEMEEKMRQDYERLQDILDEAIQKQRKHRRALLSTPKDSLYSAVNAEK